MSDAGSTALSAGWHPDPSGRHELRYWDGAAWSDSVSDQGVQATDSLAAPPTMAVPPPAYPQATTWAAPPPAYPGMPATGLSPRTKVAAALLALFLGAFGAHRFYLGYKGIGLAMLLITVLTLGLAGIVTGIWAFVEFILILTGSLKDAEGRELS